MPAGDFEFDDRPPSVPFYSRPVAPVYPPTNSLGITSLVLGVVCMPLMCVPGLNVFAIGLGGVGLLLGIAALTLSLVRNGWGIGYSIGGLCANALAILLGLWVTMVFLRAAKEIEKDQRQPSPPAQHWQ